MPCYCNKRTPACLVHALIIRTAAGHREAVLSVAFSPDGGHLATGSGDATVQFWDLSTQLRQRAGNAHNTWVMAVAWAPDGKTLASGDKAGLIHLWDGVGRKDDQKSRGACKGHTKWITALAVAASALAPASGALCLSVQGLHRTRLGRHNAPSASVYGWSLSNCECSGCGQAMT